MVQAKGKWRVRVDGKWLDLGTEYWDDEDLTDAQTKSMSAAQVGIGHLPACRHGWRVGGSEADNSAAGWLPGWSAQPCWAGNSVVLHQSPCCRSRLWRSTSACPPSCTLLWSRCAWLAVAVAVAGCIAAYVWSSIASWKRGCTCPAPALAPSSLHHTGCAHPATRALRMPPAAAADSEGPVQALGHPRRTQMGHHHLPQLVSTRVCHVRG